MSTKCSNKLQKYFNCNSTVIFLDTLKQAKHYGYGIKYNRLWGYQGWVLSRLSVVYCSHQGEEEEGECLAGDGTFLSDKIGAVIVKYHLICVEGGGGLGFWIKFKK